MRESLYKNSDLAIDSSFIARGLCGSFLWQKNCIFWIHKKIKYSIVLIEFNLIFR